jgi:hypothetical protein
VGYDDRSKRFTFKNSWGEGWGNKGDGTIPYSYATNPDLAGDFWTIINSGVAPLPEPPPPPEPEPPPPVKPIRVTLEIDPVTGVAKIVT